jgi:predicted amidohydrolase
MRVATAAYHMERFAEVAQLEAKLARWVAEAAGQGAELLVFPEYAALEAAGPQPFADGDQEGCLRAAARGRPAYDAALDRLARAHGVHILSGSGPVYAGHNGRPVNRATLFSPQGPLGHQDKAIMTRFEREAMDVVPGAGLTLFETALGRIGVLICYDSEFPLLARALAEAGAEVILAPSATEAPAGFTRVRVGAMARALENQCVTVHAPLVGASPWVVGLEENTGRASVYGPPDRGFPATGILAEGVMGAPGWVYADIDLKALRDLRADGTVLNLAHWPEQLAQVDRLHRVSAP